MRVERSVFSTLNSHESSESRLRGFRGRGAADIRTADVSSSRTEDDARSTTRCCGSSTSSVSSASLVTPTW